ncbi:tubulin folding cofactor D C terminal-domain-containing protein [Boeremia exigua]|uniref:tubulin folding cofactor D C terminal-domain-containing protein n=1 Tax=Boeremia exigua TaxID=749465 RepID=UPI001E8DC2EB|nr:tubulin folding cofactor D C terminal-domain-containing protein [Boeremia exigua]KAH6614108.1 tubulin folding cofactor D C terminal-domain-containing protein [Boeremia exigua]
MMSGEDDDLKLQRASSALLSDLEKLLPRLIRGRQYGSSTAAVRHHVREVDMHRACALIEPFQEDPQLLDTHLKNLLPPLVAAYLDLLQAPSRERSQKGFLPLSHAICYIINLFTKVRGEKVIQGFLNNEPRYLEPVLREFEGGKNFQKEPDDSLPQSIVPWTERYVLLLWLSHLLLAPFPLASISTLQSSEETSAALGIELPAEIPGITLRVLNICFQCLQSASKERTAAAKLLVTLCVRPDMQDLGLLHILVNWSLSFFSNATEDASDIHRCIGILSFMSGLVASATNDEIGPFLAPAFQVCQRILSQDNLKFLKSSAVARKLVVKTMRNIVVHCLQANSSPTGLDPTTALEEVVEALLEAVGDGDTPVRYAASKALSIITLKLDPEMAEEVIEAVLGSLNESVYWQGTKRNLSGVNPLRWHGLTLTLSQLLYRKAIPMHQLPDVLNALLLSLGFEQRSPTGGSIGTNVRDAACFGIWALSRRYSTKDMLGVQTSSIRASEHRSDVSVPQTLAIELVVVACLDPAGNIRRGSSAALQELIGRHPDTIYEGIPLVQIVDFHAVGLRQRAMCDVAVKASSLHPLYWQAIFENLLGWRGTGSLDSDPRLFAARSVGLLSENQKPDTVRQMDEQICSQLKALRPREIEERQGFVAALAALVDIPNHVEYSSQGLNRPATFIHLWRLFEQQLKLEDKAFTSPAMRPEYTASSYCSLIAALARAMAILPKDDWISAIPVVEINRIVNLCLARHEETVLSAIADVAGPVLAVLRNVTASFAESLIIDWITKLENEASYSGLRCSGYAIAIGSAYGVSMSTPSGVTTELQHRILRTLTFRCTSAVAIEARTVALRALNTLLRTCEEMTKDNRSPRAADVKERIASALHIALNDYTVTERGDVGSLVRLEALNAVRTASEANLFRDQTTESDRNIYADVLRLSLEKLDKVRARAAAIIAQESIASCPDFFAVSIEDVSSQSYFTKALQAMQSTKSSIIREAICQGLVSSAGMASESVVQNCREAVLNFTITLPLTNTSGRNEFTLVDFATCLLDLLKKELENDRVLLPLLEGWAFLFDMQITHRLVSTDFNFRTLLSYIQKAHFKSTHIQKLHLALDVYRGLGTIPAARTDTLAKVTSMLLHPFPKIRITAAETLWILTQDDGLKLQDWSLPSKSLQSVVDGIKLHQAGTA